MAFVVMHDDNHPVTTFRDVTERRKKKPLRISSGHVRNPYLSTDCEGVVPPGTEPACEKVRKTAGPPVHD